jgi:hypothetical protein
MWDKIHQHHAFSYPGDLLLSLALQSLGRSRECHKIIAAQGTVVPAGRKKHTLKAHPLLGVERRAREFCLSVFKKLKIELEVNLFDRFN